MVCVVMRGFVGIRCGGCGYVGGYVADEFEV